MLQTPRKKKRAFARDTFVTKAGAPKSNVVLDNSDSHMSESDAAMPCRIVSEAMTKDLVCVKPSTTVDEALQLLFEHKVC